MSRRFKCVLSKYALKPNTMKKLKNATLSLLFVMSCTAAMSQNAAKKELFGAFSQVISCDVQLLAKTFNFKEGQPVNLQLASNFNFSGKVISNVQKYPNLQSVVIRSDNFEDALFMISKQIMEDHSIAYVGRILCKDKADGYKIARDEKGNYQLVKFDASQLVQDCTYNH